MLCLEFVFVRVQLLTVGLYKFNLKFFKSKTTSKSVKKEHLHQDRLLRVQFVGHCALCNGLANTPKVHVFDGPSSESSRGGIVLSTGCSTAKAVLLDTIRMFPTGEYFSGGSSLFSFSLVRFIWSDFCLFVNLIEVLALTVLLVLVKKTASYKIERSSSRLP